MTIYLIGGIKKMFGELLLLLAAKSKLIRDFKTLVCEKYHSMSLNISQTLI